MIQAIAEARAHGDLKENAEYHAAKEQQGFIEGRIKEIEGKLSNLQVIDVTEVDANGKVVFGSTVELLDECDREGNRVPDRRRGRGRYRRGPDLLYVADCACPDRQERGRRRNFRRAGW